MLALSVPLGCEPKGAGPSSSSASGGASLGQEASDLVDDPAKVNTNIDFAHIQSGASSVLRILYWQEVSGEATAQLRYAVRHPDGVVPGGLLISLLAGYSQDVASVPLDRSSNVLDVTLDDRVWTAKSGVMRLERDSSAEFHLAFEGVLLGTRAAAETMGPLDGWISGAVERDCYPLPADFDPAGIMPERFPDEEWTSAFCAQFVD